MRYGNLKKNKDKNILIVGDLMLDEYIVGDDYSISDEAPVPILKVDRFDTRLGGAANVANNLKHLGYGVLLCGAVGSFTIGRSSMRLLESLRHSKIATDLLVESGLKTTTKTRVIINRQQVVRYDFEDTSIPESAESRICYLLENLDISNVDIIIVSDYNKGVVSKKVMDIISGFNKKVIIDPKPNNIKLYRNAFCITPNLKEFNDIVKNNLDESDIKGIASNCKDVISKYGIKNIIVTIGPRGSVFCSKDKSIFVVGQKKEVANTIGAGDTFVAAFSFSICSGLSVIDSLKVAHTASFISVSKKYTSVCSFEELSSYAESDNIEFNCIDI